MAEWSTYLRTGKSSVLLRNFVRPGRWYQFRVASVNENGTQGFSQPITYNAQIGKLFRSVEYATKHTIINFY